MLQNNRSRRHDQFSAEIAKIRATLAIFQTFEDIQSYVSDVEKYLDLPLDSFISLRTLKICFICETTVSERSRDPKRLD